jgi:hypothetical protein
VITLEPTSRRASHLLNPEKADEACTIICAQYPPPTRTDANEYTLTYITPFLSHIWTQRKCLNLCTCTQINTTWYANAGMSTIHQALTCLHTNTFETHTGQVAHHLEGRKFCKCWMEPGTLEQYHLPLLSILVYLYVLVTLTRLFHLFSLNLFLHFSICTPLTKPNAPHHLVPFFSVSARRSASGLFI